MTASLDTRRHAASLAVLAVAQLETDPTSDVASVARLVGIHQWRVYAAWRVEHPDRPPRGRGCRTGKSGFSAAIKARVAPFAGLCDVMLDHIGRHEPTAAQIFAAVRDDYGHPAARSRSDAAGERRLWRALARPIDDGRVLRHGVPGHGCTYTRSRP